MAFKSNLLTLSIITLLLVTSCSQQKFAFRKKVPVNREESTVKVKENRNAGETVAHTPAEEQVSVAEAGTPALITNGKASENDFVKKQNELSKAPVLSKSENQKTAKKALVKQTLKKISDKKNKLDVSASSINPRQFIIIGLIILLIGVVLSIVLHGLGYLVAVVGVVFIVIGLIVILADQL